jgi:HlyD family secretion protein
MTVRERRFALVAVVGIVGLAAALAMLAPAPRTAQTAPTAGAPDEKHWMAVAPGRIEPRSGEIKVAAPVAGVIADVLVKANDIVFAGEPLIRLSDDEAQARLATAKAQAAMRKRARDDESAPFLASARRRAEDAVADAENAVMEAQTAADRAAVARRAGRGRPDAAFDAAFDAASATLSRARDRLQQERAELHRIEADARTPLPNQAEGQLNVARGELRAAAVAIDKLTIRAPLAGAVLQVNAKAGELASSTQPLLLLGDVSVLRVRVELDQRNVGQLRIGQPARIRSEAFRDREFSGTVAFIAPLVEPARIGSRGQNNLNDVDVVEVLVDLTEPSPLLVGMKVDAYFPPDATQ